jgi:ornithine cyclodeaminase/alanine dehydrogenase-like protein (mu-crystallin family)
MKTTLLTPEELRAAVPMSHAIAAVRDAFVRLRAGEFEMPVRTALGDGRVLTMTAFHAPTSSTVVKSVDLDYSRRPATQGLVLWTSGSTAYVLDAGTVTSLRTGAAVGVATDLLAPAVTRTLVLIGLGGQAADQLRAVRAVREFEAVTLVARNPDSARVFAEVHAEGLAGLDVRLSTDPAAAVADADVICCATPSTKPLFDADVLPDTLHVNAIGAYRLSMRELPGTLLSSALVVVDQREAALEESGEINHAIAEGALTSEALVELGTMLDGCPRASPRPARTVFKSVGLAMQDWAIGHALWASKDQVNFKISNPKD